MSFVAALTNRRLDTKMIHYLEDAVRSSTQGGSFFPSLKAELLKNGAVDMEAVRETDAYKALASAMTSITKVEQIDDAFTAKLADFVNAVAANAAPNHLGTYAVGSLTVQTLANGMKSVVANHRHIGSGIAA
jgi:hypothetical protein